MQDAQTVLRPPPDAEERLRKGGKGGLEGQKTFAFDKSYWSFNRADPHFAGQDNLFNDLGSPLLDNAFQGYNNCIFAYGQTGSGKTFTMSGREDVLALDDYAGTPCRCQPGCSSAWPGGLCVVHHVPDSASTIM